MPSPNAMAFFCVQRSAFIISSCWVIALTVGYYSIALLYFLGKNPSNPCL